MSVYTGNIVSGLLTFPLIAFAITLPYMVYQYRKFGSIPWLRTLIVYSFVFYMLVAYYMVILPLPENRSAVVPYAAHPQLVPFHFVQLIADSSAASLADPSTWPGLLRNPNVYEAFFNVLLLVPLGMYLRYYFRRTWWQTLALGFLVTLSFELTQLTGLWGLYEHPYRLFDVDDLIMNTLGAMVGFWAVGPAMRVLPDIRLVNEEAREAGVRASATKRLLALLIDLLVSAVAASALGFGAAAAGLTAGTAAHGLSAGMVAQGIEVLVLACVFVVAPSLTHGQTPGQKLLRLRIVRSDASPARWYQYLARYGLLYLLVVGPPAALFAVLGVPGRFGTEANALAAFIAANRDGIMAAWLALMAVWAATLIVRAVRAKAGQRPFIMLNGLLSNTRVMTCAGVERERERRSVLDVAAVGALERLIAEGGTPLSELMRRAGESVAETVRRHVPDPSPVVVLAGSGNNGGDGWVAARALAEEGYPVTLVAPDLAERLHAEPARSTAIEVFSQAGEQKLPLKVLIAPDADVLSDAIDGAAAVVDALLGTGFAGDEVREPYASWIAVANRRRFEGGRGKGRGRHRKREHARGGHEHGRRRSVPRKVKDAPFAVAVDVPSGLSAQTGAAARPTFAADMTVTMISFKPGLVVPTAARHTGAVQLAKLVDTAPYLEQLQSRE